MKAYVIIEQPNVDDYWSVKEVCLSQDICDKKIAELKKPYDDYMRQVETCQVCNGYNNDSADEYVLKGSCEMASVKTDRNGEYCENERSPHSCPEYFYKIVSELNEDCGGDVQ